MRVASRSGEASSANTGGVSGNAVNQEPRATPSQYKSPLPAEIADPTNMPCYRWPGAQCGPTVHDYLPKTATTQLPGG